MGTTPVTPALLSLLLTASVASAAFTTRLAAADPPPRPDDAPLVVYVVVPLCSNAQINCGSGRPTDLDHNIYWGAVFGARRFLERKGSGWERVAVTPGEGVFLERAIFRRMVPGAPWGRAAEVEELVVLDAVNGDAIDAAVDHFWRTTTEGGTITFDDHGARRTAAIRATGYAGHNRLMDGKLLPPAPASHASALPTFVLACNSDAHFRRPLAAAGSEAWVTTSSLMAPEGYLVDAVAKGIGERLGPVELRRRAVAAYAKWQRLTPREAGAVFARPRATP